MSRIDIPHEAIKRRVVASSACSADVAIGVLHRIDVDDEFRDALRAVLDLRDENALKQFLISQTDATTCEAEPEPEPKMTPPVRVADVIREVEERAVKIASRYLSDDALDKAINTFLQSRIHQLIASVIGYRESFGRLEIDPHGNGTMIAKRITARVEERILEVTNAILDEIHAEEIAGKLLNKHKSQLKAMYRRCFAEGLERRLYEWAQERASTDLDRVFREAGCQQEG